MCVIDCGYITLSRERWRSKPYPRHDDYNDFGERVKNSKRWSRAYTANAKPISTRNNNTNKCTQWNKFWVQITTTRKQKTMKKRSDEQSVQYSSTVCIWLNERRFYRFRSQFFGYFFAVAAAAAAASRKPSHSREYNKTRRFFSHTHTYMKRFDCNAIFEMQLPALSAIFLYTHTFLFVYFLFFSLCVCASVCSFFGGWC